MGVSQTIWWPSLLPHWQSITNALQWHHNERDGVSNHLCLDCLLNRLFRYRLRKTWMLRATALSEENPPVTGGFSSQRANNAQNVSFWWRRHTKKLCHCGLNRDCELGYISIYAYIVLLAREETFYILLYGKKKYEILGLKMNPN